MRKGVSLTLLFKIMDQSFWMDLTSLTVLAADFMWASLFYYALANPLAGWGRSCLFLALALFSTNFLSKALSFTKLKLWLQRFIFAVWMLFVLLISYQVLFFFPVKPTLLTLFTNPIQQLIQSQASANYYWHFVIVLLILWRAGSLNSRSLELFSANAGFQLGVLMFVVYGFAFGWPIYAQATFNFILFLFFSLIGMGASRLIGIGILRTGKENKISSAWPVWLLLAVFSIVVVSVLIGLLGNQILARAITTIFILLMAALAIFLFIIMYPIIWLIQQLVALARIIFNLNADTSTLFANLNERISDLGQTSSNSESVINFLKTIQPWVVGIIVLVLFSLIALSLSAFKRQKQKRLRMLSSDAERPVLKKPPKPDKGLGFFDRIRHNRRLLAAERIRRIYIRFMDLCASLKRPRPEATTPLEFFPIARDLLPGVEDELWLITESYNRIRYGELPEHENEVQEIETAWKNVRLAGVKLLRIMKKNARNSSTA
jgi:hypothetical protein